MPCKTSVAPKAHPQARQRGRPRRPSPGTCRDRARRDQRVHQRVYRRIRGQAGGMAAPSGSENRCRANHVSVSSTSRAVAAVSGVRRSVPASAGRPGTRSAPLGPVRECPRSAGRPSRAVPGPSVRACPRLPWSAIRARIARGGSSRTRPAVITGPRAGQGFGERAERDHLGDEVARLRHGGGQRRGATAAGQPTGRSSSSSAWRMAARTGLPCFPHTDRGPASDRPHLGRDVAHPGQPVPLAGEDPHGRCDQLGKPLVRVTFACHIRDCMCK